MIGIMFVNHGNSADTYQININTFKLKMIQKDIDEYYGKGGKLEVTSSVDFFVGNSSLFGKKVEIISKKYVGKRTVFSYCCADMDEENIYKFQYYAYVPHELSKMCKRLLNIDDSIVLSYCIKELLNYKCETSKEEEFKKKIMGAIRFKNINDLHLLMKIRNELNDKQKLEVNFDNVTDQKIRKLEVFNEGFHAQELKGASFKYSEEEKNNIKKKILKAIPTDEELKLR